MNNEANYHPPDVVVEDMSDIAGGDRPTENFSRSRLRSPYQSIGRGIESRSEFRIHEGLDRNLEEDTSNLLDKSYRSKVT